MEGDHLRDPRSAGRNSAPFILAGIAVAAVIVLLAYMFGPSSRNVTDGSPSLEQTAPTNSGTSKDHHRRKTEAPKGAAPEDAMGRDEGSAPVAYVTIV